MAVRVSHRRRKKIPPSRISLPRICWMLLLVTTLTATSEQCAVLRFPSLPKDLKLNTREHLTVSIPFVIDTAQCPQQHAGQPVFIYISQGSSPVPKAEDFCVLRITDDGCYSFNNKSCPCKEGGTGEASFIKTVSEADDGLWVWRSGDGGLKTEVTLNVQGAPDPSNEDKGPKAGPELKPSTSDSDQSHVLPRTTHKAPRDDTKLSPPQANTGTEKGENKVTEDQSPASEEMEKVEKDEKNDKETSSADDEKAVDSFMATGVMIGLVNVFTIIVVVVVVFVLVRRHSRKSKRHPRDSIPPLPSDAKLPGQRHGEPGDEVNKYNTIASVALSHYEVLPLPDEAIVIVDNDGYLKPAARAEDDDKDEYVDIC